MGKTKDLFVAVWKYNSLSQMNAGPEAKKKQMKEAVGAAFRAMEDEYKKLKKDNKAIYLFVAPEYYWLNGHQYTHFNENERESIYAYLGNLSKEWPDVILIPGSVQWQTPKTKCGIPCENHDQVMKSDKNHVAFNTTPVYFDGQQILLYHKKFDDKIVQTYSKKHDAIFGAGPSGGAQDFRACGLRFGLEVCGDIVKGYLKKSLKEQKVDVMVLTSATVNHNFSDAIDNIPVRDGGAFVHCDSTGVPDKNGLWLLERGGGWHGSNNAMTHYGFIDLDGEMRTIGLPNDRTEGKQVALTPVKGFDSTKPLIASVSSRFHKTKEILGFSFKLPPTTKHREQDVEIENVKGVWQATVSREKAILSRAKSKVARTDNDTMSKKDPKMFAADYLMRVEDTAGTQITGEGNVSKIGKLLTLKEQNIDCYYVPISKD